MGRIKPHRIIAVVLLLAGIGSAAVCIYTTRNKMAFVRNSTVLEGTITGFQESWMSTEDRRTTYNPVVAISVDGRTESFTSSLGFLEASNPYSAGQKVEVLRTADGKCEIASSDALWTASFLTGLAALIFTAIGIAELADSRKK